MSSFLILGHGYSAGFITPALTGRGWQVTGTTRHAPGAVAAAGARPILWPGSGAEEEALACAIKAADGILIAVGPTGDGDPVLNAWGPEIAAARPAWLGYLSATSVYGDSGGAWVDEATPPAPASRRGAERLAAERGWQALAAAAQLPLMIFRLAGIYGPGRGPIDKLRDGTARRIIKPGQVFSRIHADDIAGAILASLDRPHPGAIWNLCDDTPAPPQDIIADAAALTGLPLPPAEDFETAEMSPMARSFYGESKRVSNARIKADLGWAPRYPDHQSGLRAILAAEKRNGG
ncbi:SDR family NAD(P)-dependent oxidoreductase [Paracoccus suum]|uniref:SDR family NAD(P)-dependent oxidoreductase n=1 Tax=Paracoccus suum TaxID=2259340 RepID=A0A344PIQ6_9RHOB|nr:SDR family oxidoreductase [Paracoccus suum]AXC49261.1 SDR family NAD(P)-dependent oxidoreductase [Paracoccus suum]